MRILQAANFVTPVSGGLRTTLDALAEGYVAAGHDVVRIVPGPADHLGRTGSTSVVELAAPQVPLLGGYRVITSGRRLDAVVDRLRPDRIEVSDRVTLQRLGRWGAARGVPTVAIVHERLDALLARWVPGGRMARRLADSWNRRLVAAVDTVVCSTAWSRAEFDRIAALETARSRWASTCSCSIPHVGRRRCAGPSHRGARS